MYWLLEKFDAESRKQVELAHPGTDVLTLKELTTFMDKRSRALGSSGDQPEFSTPKTTPKKVHQEADSSTVEHSPQLLSDERMQWFTFNLPVRSLQTVGHAREKGSCEEAQTVHELFGAAFRG